MVENEVWLNIPNYEGHYQISSLGRVKSLKKNIYEKSGKLKRVNDEIYLKPALSANGYLNVSLFKDFKKRSLSVHQLIAIAFLGHIPCGFKTVVDHKNENPLDNRLSNLQLLTYRENTVKSINKDKSSKYTGVKKRENGKFKAYISREGKIIHLGTFEEEEDAYKSYEDALNAIKNGQEIILKRKVKSSKYKGVWFWKVRNKWVSTFKLNGENKYLGVFKTEEEAHLCYQNYAKSIQNK